MWHHMNLFILWIYPPDSGLRAGPYTNYLVLLGWQPSSKTQGGLGLRLAAISSHVWTLLFSRKLFISCVSVV